MARIIIPYPMQRHTNQQRIIEVAGKNLKEVTDSMVKTYPGLETPIQKAKDFLAVFVNGERIMSGAGEWAKVPLSDSDEVTLILPIAGGSLAVIPEGFIGDMVLNRIPDNFIRE